MRFIKNLKRESILMIVIVIFLFLNLLRSLSLDIDGSSGSNLCTKLNSEVKSFLLYNDGILHEYLQEKGFNGELQLGFVNYLESNIENNIFYISAYRYDSDYYEGKIRTWVVNDLKNPDLIFETNEVIFIAQPSKNENILDFKNDPAFSTATECSRVEKFLYEQRN